jgi:hypothetical protein
MTNFKIEQKVQRPQRSLQCRGAHICKYMCVQDYDISEPISERFPSTLKNITLCNVLQEVYIYNVCIIKMVIHFIQF